MKTLFLLCALALPVGSFHPGDSGDRDNPETRETFIKELEWLENLLKKNHPGYEWMIIINQEHVVTNIPGWEWLPFFWRGHAIYRRKIPKDFEVSA